MWPFKKKTRQRRLEALKSRPSGQESRWRRFRQAGGSGAMLLAVGLGIAAVLIDVLPTDPMPYRPGQYVQQDIRARVDFRIPSQRAILERLEKARLSTPAIFQADTELVDQIVSTVAGLPGRLASTTRPVDLGDAVRNQFALQNADVLAAWRKYAEPPHRDKLEAQLNALRESLVATCLATDEDVREQQTGPTAPSIILMYHGKVRGEPRKANMVSLADGQKVTETIARASHAFDPAVSESVKTYLLAMLTNGRPLYRYDAAGTQQSINLRIAEIRRDPPTDLYAAGQILVHGQRKGEHKPVVIEATDMELLEHEHEAYVADERQTHSWRRRGRLLGRTAIVALIVALLCVYVAHYQTRIVRNIWRGIALALVLVLMLALGKSLVFLLELNSYSAVFAVMFATIIITIAYDQRFALAIGSALALLVVLQLRQDYSMLLVLLAGVAAVVFQLHEIRTRSKLIKVSAVAAGIAFATICALGLTGTTPWRFVLIDGLWAAGAALATGMVVQVILPLVERVFGIATSMTLLEWCDASKPLLKRLATEAPGTWNHCLQLGAMCEAAAETIGANGLLARVGAYYHDIGKISKPDYFVENQAGSASKHEKLSPEMSLLIILGHVKDGLEMARASSLPQILRQFITTHHGTTLVQYFYHAATEQRKGEPGRVPEEVEFRYPGPKPRTKETGILMLADAAESSVRSMSEPTPGRIESQVRTMVNRRLMDGQLDECEMTLREVHQVESSLVKNLCSIYHARISYPTPEGQPPSAGEVQPRSGKADQTAAGGPQAGTSTATDAT